MTELELKQLTLENKQRKKISLFEAYKRTTNTSQRPLIGQKWSLKSQK